MKITSSGLVFCRGCRPAGLSRPCTFAKHILPCHKTTRDPPMDPYELDIQANTKVMTERPSTWIKGPIFSTCRDLLDRSTTMDFMHPLIKTSVKQRAEKCQLQAGLQFSALNQHNLHRHQEEIRSVHEKVSAKWRKSQAGWPRRGWPAPLCSILSSSSRGSYVNRPSCVHPTPRPNTDL